MTLKSTITAALAAATMLTSVGAAFAAPGVTLGAVNMRDEPGTYGDIVDTLPKGKFLDIIECDGGWCAVEVNGDGGYVSAKFLALIDDEDDDDDDDDEDDDEDYDDDDDVDVEFCVGGGGFGGGGFGFGKFCVED